MKLTLGLAGNKYSTQLYPWSGSIATIINYESGITIGLSFLVFYFVFEKFYITQE
ncbi:MAG TPA: hypothetical protein VGX92_12530 [Pyrinomonadaceae bacterium]|nr:hypothetical protein [Pyrinomonadaceae bacterium]